MIVRGVLFDLNSDLGPMMGGDGGGGLAPFSFEDILKHCLEPTVKDGLQHVGKVILWCVVFRIITQSNTGQNSKTDFFG